MNTPSPQEIEQYVVVASDASNPQHQQQANALLHQWVSTHGDEVIGDTILTVLRFTQREVVLFYALTMYLRLENATPHQRAVFRQEILSQLVLSSASVTPAAAMTSPASNYPSTRWGPTYLRTKVGVLLAHFLLLDFPRLWPSALDDLTAPQLLHTCPDILLRTLSALMEDFGKNETFRTANLKDYLRGYSNDKMNANKNGSSEQEPDQHRVLAPNPSQSPSGRLLWTVLSILDQSLVAFSSNALNGGGKMESTVQLVTLCSTVLKEFMSWLDLTLVLGDKVLKLIFLTLAKASTVDSPLADAGVAAIECMEELISRGMEDDRKIYLLQHTKVLEKIHQYVDLCTVDACPIDVVMEVAKFINRTGLEVFPLLHNTQEELKPEVQALKVQLLGLFFQCFAFDDIDVSGAVIPLAGSLITESSETSSDTLLPKLITITFSQMKYPSDFQYDFDDDDEAEEEMYRAELRKLNQKMIRANSDLCLHFLVKAMSDLPLPLSTAPTPNIQAAISWVYHFCEGIRPPPGMKVVMKNDTFRNVIVALHSSNIDQHPHREILNLYYETSVRYYPLFKDRPDLLEKLLQSMTGSRGLKHQDRKVRSRCCYLLLRLIKSLGNNNSKSYNSILRPYVETSIVGIRNLLESSNVELRSDDTFNLFETIGLLLGKCGLSPQEQQQYLTQVMAPHVLSIESILREHKQSVQQDPEHYGERLSNSIAAIAYLSKGFKHPSAEVQEVLYQASRVAIKVLETLSENDQVRKQTCILVQRLIQCLERKVLPMMPQILFLLISNCTTDDVIDVSQMMNQLCIKFRSGAIEALDCCLLLFLQKCQFLSNTVVPDASKANDDNNLNAPHIRTEQLSIQKLSYVVLQHVVVHRTTALLLSPNILPKLEAILQIMSEGAVRVEDPVVKKSCLVFFRELLDQWVVENNDGYQEPSSIIPPDGVVQGILRFFSAEVFSRMVRAFFAMERSIIEDANQFRCLSEFCGILEVVKNRLPAGYFEELLVSNFPGDLVESFRVAGSGKDFEAIFKSLILENRQRSATDAIAY